MIRFIMCCVLTGVVGASVAQQTLTPLYKDSTRTAEARVKDLLGRMTLQEKIAQMTHLHGEHYDDRGEVNMQKLRSFTKGMSVGCIEGISYTSSEYINAIYKVQKSMKQDTRLGIPVLPVMEGLHGIVQDGAMIYPQSIAIGATFNPGLTLQMAGQIGAEMKSMGIKQVLAPDLDLARELRWGRVEETYGEDPFLVSIMGAAYVQGLHKHRIICTPKHFIGHGSPLGGLNLASVEGGKRQLLNLYLQPFERAIKAEPLSIMNCYSSYDGEPVAGSSYFMTELLRKQLGFKGYVYSDWGSIAMLSYFHRTADGPEDAASQAVEAGIDLEAGGNNYQKLEQLVKDGKVDIRYIDSAVSHILYAKFVSGLFEDPLPDTNYIATGLHSPASTQLARQMADESAVLLQNDGILPLDVNKQKVVAVIGPNADQVQFGDYSWSRSNNDGVTALKGIEALAGNKATIHYARGCDLVSQDSSGFSEAAKAAANSDVALVFVGTQSASLARDYKNATSGEGFDLSDLKLPGVQEELVKAVKRSGKPVVVVLVTGKPFAIPWIKANADAIIAQFYAGQQQGNAIAGILFGNVNPSGRLPVSFPQSVGHLPVYYNYLPSDKGFYKKSGTPEKPGRDYVFSSPDALWSFGYGQSYTKFQYANMMVAKEQYRLKDTIEVTLDVTNTGKRNGKDVVQLYVRDVVSSIATPIHQLKAFEKIDLAKDETKKVILKIPVSELALYNKDYLKVVEPGDFELQLGTSSDAIYWKKMIRVADADGNKTQLKGFANAQRDLPQPTAKGNRKIVISGLVRDVQASLLSSVKVSAKKSGNYVFTNDKGAYEIEVQDNDVLIFSAKGYTKQEVPVNNNQTISIKLIPSQDE
ncbi:glycoside hydrolase family 3 N-terminal domain-containing protein [Chitinophagaceae bacterium 26-R-25]|nr:glycoside hydrolase family 3 N-terminal domain-containing protein [Chitinophagaceae bacterium 26-R-25]